MSHNEVLNGDYWMFLGFDLDGVIIDHSFVKIQIAKKFGLNLNRRQTHADNIYRLLGPSKYDEFKHYLYDDPKTAMGGVIMHGSKRILQTLKKRGVPFVVISRRKGNYDIPFGLLRKCGLFPDILNDQNVFFVPKREDKNTKAASLGISHFVDDELRALEELVDVPVKYLFDPYNVATDSRYVRVASWKEFYDSII